MTPDIAAQFRRIELEKREIRRRSLLAQLRNEMALENEPLDKAAVTATKAAAESLERQALQYRRYQGYGYWRTLWLAITGRLN